MQPGPKIARLRCLTHPIASHCRSASTALENTVVFAWYTGGSDIFVATLVDAGVDELNYAPEQALAQPEITDVVAVSGMQSFNRGGWVESSNLRGSFA